MLLVVFPSTNVSVCLTHLREDDSFLLLWFTLTLLFTSFFSEILIFSALFKQKEILNLQWISKEQFVNT